MKQVRVMTIFGTRPEAIKMAPLVAELQRRPGLEPVCCVTAQHREMLDSVLEIFRLRPDYDLNIMEPRQTLSTITSKCLLGMEGVLEQARPDLVLVHGDTSTTFAGALAAFYHQIRVGHVEAGLRTGDKYSPFPEEMNRKLVGDIADLHFCPTRANRANLEREGITDGVFVTGNTVIDALKTTVVKDYHFTTDLLNHLDYTGRKIILVTCHRRENYGQPMANIMTALRRVADAFPEVELVYRRHPSEWNSPALEELARKCPNFHVIFADSVKQWIVAADSISIWMSTAIAEVYMAGKSCHILRPVPIEHEYDPVIYKDAHYVTRYDEFAAAMAEPEPPFPIAKDVIEGYFDPGETPAYKRMADLLEDVYKNPPRDEPMGDGFTPHFNKLKFCALAGVHFLYRRGWEPKKLFAFCPPLANFAQRIYGYVDKAHVTPEQVAAMEARIKPFVK